MRYLQPRRRFGIFVVVAVLLVSTTVRPSVAGDSDATTKRQLNRICGLIKEGVRQGILVGAQVAVGTSKGNPLCESLGVIAPLSPQEVDDSTQFCIGSCSKPFAAVCILALSEGDDVDLNTPIERWVPQMANAVTAQGQAVPHAPTLRELLAHRGGIYSQKQGPMTPDQVRAIRDFTLTLRESVEIISQQPLIAAPGEEYAYSGAGYCLAGFAAEQASGLPFEDSVQRRIAQPMGLTRTTYFPEPDEKNIAVPGMKNRSGQIIAQARAPHLLKARLKLPLIGGSLYSTASETAAFARMILNEGRAGDQRILSMRSWRDLTRPQYQGQGYGLGWVLTIKNRRVTAMQHTGALLGYHSLIAVDGVGERYVVVHWTATNPNDPRGDQFRDDLEKLAFGGS